MTFFCVLQYYLATLTPRNQLIAAAIFFTFCWLAKKGKKKGDFLGQVDRRTRIDSRPGDPDGDPDRPGGSARRLAEAEGELRKQIIFDKHLVIW